MTNDEIVKRVERLRGNRTPAEGVWEEVERYVAPLSDGKFFGNTQTESGKDWSTKQVWDSTAIIGADRLAGFIHSAMVSDTFQWFRAAFRNGQIQKEPAAKRWLEEAVRRMYLALTASNFGVETASGFHLLVGYGNACLVEELANPDKWDGLEFSGPALREFVFEEDALGRPYRFFRELEWTASQLISKFGADKVPQLVKDYDQKGDDQRLKCILAIFPRKGARPVTLAEKRRAPDQRPWAYRYVLCKTKETLGDEGGYYEMPAFVARWARTPGSSWGYGPGVLALPTVKLVNVWLEAMTNAAEKTVDPATLVTERGLLSDLDLGKGGLTTVRSLDDIKPYESAARFDISEVILNDMRDMIRRYFREDDLVMKDSPAMTATEAQIRYDLMNKLFARPARRIQNDWLDPVIQTTFGLMYREGQIDPPPPVVTESEMRIEYLGPLMAAQRSDEVAALERLASGVAALQKMGFAEVGDVFNPQMLVREMAERLSTPGSVLRSEDEAKALRAQREQLQAAAAQAEIARNEAGAMKDMAAAMGAGNGNA
jgi:hypothetical protein